VQQHRRLLSLPAAPLRADTSARGSPTRSSDFWSGDAPASAATFNFQFRGSRIVAAVIKDLISAHGMGSTAGERLLFGGCSAGAIGAMNNIEAVAALLPAGLEYRNLLDGAALLDITPSGWSFSSELETLQSLMADLASISAPQFPAYCATAFPGEEYKCLLGQYRMPMLTKTPFFMNAPQFVRCPCTTIARVRFCCSFADAPTAHRSECFRARRICSSLCAIRASSVHACTHACCAYLTHAVRALRNQTGTTRTTTRPPRPRSCRSWTSFSPARWRSSRRCRPARACSAPRAWRTA
jgi:hypothetical protein